MDEEIANAAADEAGGGEAAVSDPPPFSVADAVEKAIEDVEAPAKGAAETRAKADKGDESSEAGKAVQQKSESKAVAAEATSGETEKGGKSEDPQPKFYTAEDYKTIDLYDLDMERVPPELRATVRAQKANITRKGEQEAAKRRAAQTEEKSKETVTETPKKQLSKAELYDRLLDPDTFEETLDDLVSTKARKLLAEEFQIDPVDSRERAQSSRVNRAITSAIAATETNPGIPELQEGSADFDPEVMKSIGNEIDRNPELKQFFLTTTDVGRLQEKFELIAGRALLRAAKARGQQVQKDTVVAQSEQAKAKSAKEQLNEKEQAGQKASKSTGRAVPKKDLTTVADHVGRAFEEVKPRSIGN